MNESKSSLRCAAGLSLLLLLAAGGALAQTQAPSRPQPAAGEHGTDGMVNVPARQLQDIERTRREAGGCIRIEDDAERLACYDELVARRIPVADPDLPGLPAGRYGLLPAGEKK